ncbi:MAG TPA: ABC transporter ATP-binding protein, partial [Puia sp.]
NGKIKVFKGPYDEWVEWNKRMNAQAKASSPKKKNEMPPEEPVKPPPVQQPVNKEAKKQLQKQQRIVDQLDEKLKVLKEDSRMLELQLSAPEIYADKQKFMDAEMAYKKADQALSEGRLAYDAALERLMELEEGQA